MPAARRCAGGGIGETASAATGAGAAFAGAVFAAAAFTGGGASAGSSIVGASSSAISLSISAEIGLNPCGRSAGFLAVQCATRSHTDCGMPASCSGSIFNGSFRML